MRELDRRQSRQFTDVVRPELAENGIRIVTCEQSTAPASLIARHFREQIFPVLTPLAIGPGRPFPYISNLSLSLIVRLHDPDLDQEVYARVKVPKEVLPRFVEISPNTFISLEEIIARHLDQLFPGLEIISYDMFRVTRDADFEVSDEADDLLEAVEDELRRRRFGEVVRLEVGASMDPAMRARLIEWLGVDDVQVYDVEGLLDLSDLWQIAGLDGHSDIRQVPWTPITHPAFGPAPGDQNDQPDVFAPMRTRDVLVHYPYQSFATSVERFVKQAVDDPNVLAIKMTVYRTSDDSALIPSLIEAAEKGKQAVAMVELKARFDERQNIGWSRALEEVGAHVVHGIPGLKTHAKAILVVRRERGGVRHYVMIGTGNFHAKNARLYEDFGLFTTDREIGQEVANLFNTLTGYGHPARERKVLVAPNSMRGPLIEEIDRTIAAHEAGEPSRIAMKMNSLVDQQCIEALYRASQAGRPDRPQRPRHLRPGSGRTERQRDDLGRVGRRAVPRALADLLVPSRRGERLLHRVGRPHAPQPRHPRRAAHAGRGSRTAARARGHARAVHGRRHVRVDARFRRGVDPAHRSDAQRPPRADGADAPAAGLDGRRFVAEAGAGASNDRGRRSGRPRWFAIRSRASYGVPKPPPWLWLRVVALAGWAPSVSLMLLLCPPRLTVSVTVSPGA